MSFSWNCLSEQYTGHHYPKEAMSSFWPLEQMWVFNQNTQMSTQASPANLNLHTHCHFKRMPPGSLVQSEVPSETSYPFTWNKHSISKWTQTAPSRHQVTEWLQCDRCMTWSSRHRCIYPSSTSKGSCVGPLPSPSASLSDVPLTDSMLINF